MGPGPTKAACAEGAATTVRRERAALGVDGRVVGLAHEAAALSSARVAELGVTTSDALGHRRDEDDGVATHSVGDEIDKRFRVQRKAAE